MTDVPWVVEPTAEFRELAETGPDIVISDGLAYSLDPRVIDDFPEVRFGIFDVAVTSPNASSVLFANEEGGYLAGAAAALKTETATVGFIGAKRVPEIEAYQAGFEAGARAINPDVTVLATYIDQFDDMSAAGFSNPDLGADRARALYRRGADVVFAAAGGSGVGLFDVVVEESQSRGPPAVGDRRGQRQWFDVDVEQQDYVLTSIIKRGDVAAYRLIEQMIDDESGIQTLRLGLADDAFGFSQQGEGLTAEMIGILDQLVDDIAAGRLDVPTSTTTPALWLDADVNSVTPAATDPSLDTDGTVSHEVTELGTPMSLSLEAEWVPTRNNPGEAILTYREQSPEGYNRRLIFLRPHGLSDPRQPHVLGPTWPLDDIERWLDNVIDGIIITDPQQVTIGGRDSLYFEAEITDPAAVCGTASFCAGFVANTYQPGPEFGGEGVISGWTFMPGFHDRIWWIDQCTEAPLVIIAQTASTDRDFQQTADALLDTLTIGDPQPHPVPFDQSGLPG